MSLIEYSPIGTIRSPHTELSGMPIQPTAAEGIEGSVVMLPEYQDGLRDLDGFSHIILLYHLHKSQGYSLTVTPFLDTEERGLFATRAPKRPNPIGLSVVRLVSANENILHIKDVDILDGTPLLDIKPYVPAMRPHKHIRTGWLESVDAKRIQRQKSDNRFGKMKK